MPRLIDTGVQILLGEIWIVGEQLVDKFEFGSMCHLIDDYIKGPYHSGHCDHQDWFIGRYLCWIPMRWYCLYVQLAAGHKIQSLERMPLPFFTNNPRKVVVR
jgi:hypothetical protein